jgi:hypothetical protein
LVALKAALPDRLLLSAGYPSWLRGSRLLSHCHAKVN